MDVSMANAASAPFGFASYVREDADDGGLLNEFLDALADGLAKLIPSDRKAALFVDRSNISAGNLWQPVLADALRQAKVFVAIYTPRYFHKTETKCYCGREFAAFWERSETGADQLNIFPVLWRVPPPGYSTFPPTCVSMINYLFDSEYTDRLALEIYQKEGLEGVLLRVGKKPYRSLVSDIVRAILELADSAPDSLPGLPPFDSIPCAFHTDQEEFEAYPVASPENLAEQGGPKQVELIYVTEDAVGLSSELIDFGLSRKIFSRDTQTHILRWQLSDGTDQLIRTLIRATQKAQIPIVVLPSDFAQRASLREVAEKLVKASGWTGAVIALYSDVPIESTASVRVESLAGDPNQIRDQLASMLADIRRSMAQQANVPRPARGDGPDRMPRL